MQTPAIKCREQILERKRDGSYITAQREPREKTFWGQKTELESGLALILE